MVVFKNLFRIGDPFADPKREHKPLPLKRKGDINYIVQRYIVKIEKVGSQIIHIDQTRHNKTVMIYDNSIGIRTMKIFNLFTYKSRSLTLKS